MDMSVWYLMGAALVFFMQCGFAMVEAGFTRAKNVGNITMKNLMDFCIGTVAFYLLGYNLLCGEGGFVGWGLNPFTGFGETDWSAFVFNLVFCATAATIVSGAMAERTKFITYCIYSFIISLVVYPVEAHWVWGATPWLTDMGFTDFAGSACIHMVGGITAFIGAAMLGPRIGKYDKNGKARPILGHNILIGALGVFILWFGWYGFNGAAAITDFCNNNNCSGSRNSKCNALYMDQKWKTGCFHVLKRISCRSCGSHSRMCKCRCHWFFHHRCSCRCSGLRSSILY